MNMINCWDGHWYAEEGEPIHVEVFVDWRTIANRNDYGGVKVCLKVEGRWYAIDRTPFPGYKPYREHDFGLKALTLFLDEIDTPPDESTLMQLNLVGGWQHLGF